MVAIFEWLQNFVKFIYKLQMGKMSVECICVYFVFEVAKISPNFQNLPVCLDQVFFDYNGTIWLNISKELIFFKVYF